MHVNWTLVALRFGSGPVQPSRQLSYRSLSSFLHLYFILFDCNLLLLMSITDYRRQLWYTQLKYVDYGQRVVSGSQCQDPLAVRVPEARPIEQVKFGEYLYDSSPFCFLQKRHYNALEYYHVSIIYNPTLELKPRTWHNQWHLPLHNVLWRSNARCAFTTRGCTEYQTSNFEP